MTQAAATAAPASSRSRSLSSRLEHRASWWVTAVLLLMFGLALTSMAQKAPTFDEQGFMADYQEWDRDVASELATEVGIADLTERHWQVIEFVRSDYEAQGDAPTLRRITKAGGVPTKELYKLFPKGPAKKVAYVAGLKKPSGCI